MTQTVHTTTETMSLGVVIERRDSDHRWQSHSWHAVGVIAGAPAIETPRLLREADGVAQYHAATLDIVLHRTDTEGYRLNLATGLPTVYVVLRYDDEVEAGIYPFLATVSPYEAQNCLDGDEDLVEPVPMPDVVQAWLADFIAKYHVDEPFKKRKRKPFDPRKGQAVHAGRR